MDGDCPDCVEQEGLCWRHVCRRAVLPQLKQPGLIRLMGNALVEQTDAQEPEPEEKVELERIARRNARKVARSKRRGYYGLAKAIMAAK